MKNDNMKLYDFLQAAAGNWRNAIYIECESCSCSPAVRCSGFLLVAGADGAPLLLSTEWFHEQTGEQIDKDECVSVLSKTAFESAYSLWLKWQVSNPMQCTLLQVSD